MARLIQGGAEYRGVKFRDVDLEGVVIDDANMRHALLHEVDLTDAKIEGRVERLTVNGFRVDLLIDAELLRLFPERAKLHAKTPGEFRDALEYVHRLRNETIERAAKLPAPHVSRETESGDWSVVNQLRHLLFAEGRWANRRAFGDTQPFHPLSLPPSFSDDVLSQFGITVVESCTLGDVRAALTQTSEGIRAGFEGLTPDSLARRATVPDEDVTVARALLVYLHHEWEHHRSMGQIMDGLEHE